MSKTIIVSNRLPVKIKRIGDDYEYQTSEGGLATGLGSVYKEGDNVWVGWPGTYINKKSEKKDITSYLQDNNMSPVFLTEEEISDYYEGFSNETLWPTFHYFTNYAKHENRLWDAYVRVNAKFADAVIALAEPGDTIWVHDYQLLLLPKMIRENLPDSTIGFFQHIPFPSYEVFRLLPWRRKLLKGMLGADLIGFHTYDDMRHFLSSVNRIVMLTHTNGQVEVGSRRVVVDAFPMGIDYEKFRSTASQPETLKKEVKYRTALGDVKTILTIDRLDYSKGIPCRLQAFENFLARNSDWHDKVSMVMVLVPSRDTVGRYKALKTDVDERVGRINSKYGNLGWTPIHYFYRSFPFTSLSAFYRLADVALVTPMRDGMNLVAKEYIASKLDRRGVLVLSEMAGASKELLDSLVINPNDVDGIADAVKAALIMPEAEQERRMRNMQKTISKYDIFHWVKVFIDRLNFVKEKQKSLNTHLIDQTDAQEIIKAYSTAKHRLIIADYDGTLMPHEDDPLISSPDNELLELLQNLAGQESTDIAIISSRTAENLLEWLGHIPLYMVGEHGVYIRGKTGDFRPIVQPDNSWKDEIRPILEDYVGRTPGAFLEEKEYSLVWHYRRVQTGLGELRMRELTSHLRYLAANLNLQVVDGENVVEIKSLTVSKGKAARTILEETSTPDFILCFGDDWTDEDTFKAMPEHAFTVRIGTSASVARYKLLNSEDARRLLSQLLRSKSKAIASQSLS
jgi:trehalose 6-phosphate synthase/phosphatase